MRSEADHSCPGTNGCARACFRLDRLIVDHSAQLPGTAPLIRHWSSIKAGPQFVDPALPSRTLRRSCAGRPRRGGGGGRCREPNARSGRRADRERPGGVQQARDPVFHQLGDSHRVRRDNREAERHRLHRDDRTPLPETGHAEDVGLHVVAAGARPGPTGPAKLTRSLQDGAASPAARDGGASSHRRRSQAAREGCGGEARPGRRSGSSGPSPTPAGRPRGGEAHRHPDLPCRCARKRASGRRGRT